MNSMITVNTKVNCDELIMNDCVPYFKGIDISRFDFGFFGFIMVSKSVGNAISENVISSDGRLQMRSMSTIRRYLLFMSHVELLRANLSQ